MEWGIDLQTEHERYLTEEVFRQPVIVFNYPAAIKAFYMRLNEDGRTVAAMDVLVPKVCEEGFGGVWEVWRGFGGLGVPAAVNGGGRGGGEGGMWSRHTCSPACLEPTRVGVGSPGAKMEREVGVRRDEPEVCRRGRWQGASERGVNWGQTKRG